MKPLTLCTLALLLAAAGCAGPEEKHDTADALAVMDTTAVPPRSLNALYPPSGEAPVYLLRMFDLSTPLAGIAVDLREQDFDNAAANYEEFRRQYEQVSTLVPEWADDFPMAPVDELGRAIESREQEAVAAASQAVSAVCHNCHLLNMVPVQQRYRWPQFSAIRVTDPVSRTEVQLSDYMMSMEIPFSGVMIDMRQGQLDNARQLFKAFSTRFRELPDLCTSCHDTEREYFVDDSVQRLVDRVEGELSGTSPDPDKIGPLMERIGFESCSPCHLVHLPAAYAQARWESSH